MIKSKRIIADSIKDHFIPQVSSKNTPNEMFDALTILFEGKNINKRVTLRNQLKGVKIQKRETMQSYFTRVFQIKEQLEAIGDMVEEAKIVMTTLNGLPRDWESFIGCICSRRNITKFSRLWKEYLQEEGRIDNIEENLNDDDDKALEDHAKKGSNKRKDHDQSPRRNQKFQT